MEALPILTTAGVMTLRFASGTVEVHVRPVNADGAGSIEQSFRVDSSFMWDATLDAGTSVAILFQEAGNIFVIRKLTLDAHTRQFALNEIWRGSLDGAPHRLIVVNDQDYFVHGHERLFRIRPGVGACEMRAVRRASADATFVAVRGNRLVVRNSPDAASFEFRGNVCRDARRTSTIETPGKITLLGSAGDAIVAVVNHQAAHRYELYLFGWSGRPLRAPVLLPEGVWTRIVSVGDAAVIYDEPESGALYVRNGIVRHFRKPPGAYIAQSSDASLLVSVSPTDVHTIDLTRMEELR